MLLLMATSTIVTDTLLAMAQPSMTLSTYILPKSQVDAVGCWIQEAHKHAPTKIPTAIPDEVIDQC